MLKYVFFDKLKTAKIDYFLEILIPSRLKEDRNINNNNLQKKNRIKL